MEAHSHSDRSMDIDPVSVAIFSPAVMPKECPGFKRVKKRQSVTSWSGNHASMDIDVQGLYSVKEGQKETSVLSGNDNNGSIDTCRVSVAIFSSWKRCPSTVQSSKGSQRHSLLYQEMAIMTPWTLMSKHCPKFKRVKKTQSVISGNANHGFMDTCRGCVAIPCSWT